MIIKGSKLFKDLSYTEKEKIVSIVLEEAKRMKRLMEAVSCNEISKIVLMKTGVHLRRGVIWNWITGRNTPMGKFKAIRRPPDENAQIVRGLSLTDVSSRNVYHTISLFFHTTKDFFAQRVQRFLSKYGWTVVEPILVNDEPQWKMRAFLDHSAWIHELQKPIEELTNEEKIKLLSGVISGDGYIAVNTFQNYAQFRIVLVTTRKHKAELYRRLLDSMGIRYGFTRRRTKGIQKKFKNTIIHTRAPYMYQIIVAEENAVKYLLENLRLLQPFREVKRILALQFIEKDACDRDIVKPVWDYLRILEKYSTIRSQIRACELIPDEKFAKKSLDRQRILKELHRKLYEYADRVRELRPEAKKIISGLRAIPSMGNIMRAAEEAGFTIPKEAGFIIARILERHQEAKITNGNSEKYARALIATNLVRLRLIRTQSKAARLLSISQGVVSRYLHRRREMSSLLKLPEVERLSREYFYSRSDEVIKKVRRILEAIAEVYNGYKATKYF
ncbi:MAG: helix-turn-helix domain-containing protein [Aigarchaeota archaeon]|nr:helix-turn-helix domain-containing protein [Candidatus Wolframiiraptor gerlachensis]